MKILPLLLAMSLFSCHKPKAPKTPEEAVEAYALAVHQKDAKAAYALLGGELKKRFPTEESFDTFFAKNYAEIADEAARMVAHPLTQQATLPLRDGSQALLQKSPQGWWVQEASPLPAATTVPLALQGLQELAHRSADGGPLGYYLSEDALLERRIRLQAFADLLAKVGEYDISIDGAQAAVQLKDGRVLWFHYEAGRWTLVTLPEELLF